MTLNPQNQHIQVYHINVHVHAHTAWYARVHLKQLNPQKVTECQSVKIKLFKKFPTIRYVHVGTFVHHACIVAVHVTCRSMRSTDPELSPT